MDSPTIGHNSGAALTLAEQLAEDNAALVKRTKELREAAGRASRLKISDDTTSGMIADQVEAVPRAHRRAEEGARNHKGAVPAGQGGSWIRSSIR
jgi:hypothetical protein